MASYLFTLIWRQSQKLYAIWFGNYTVAELQTKTCNYIPENRECHYSFTFCWLRQFGFGVIWYMHLTRHIVKLLEIDVAETNKGCTVWPLVDRHKHLFCARIISCQGVNTQKLMIICPQRKHKTKPSAYSTGQTVDAGKYARWDVMSMLLVTRLYMNPFQSRIWPVPLMCYRQAIFISHVTGEAIERESQC